MSSDKKIAANRRNSAQSTGPKTEVGKQHSKSNALKHRIFAKEILVNDSDRQEFELLQSALLNQLSPSTALQRVAFDRILCSIWRHKLAVKLDAKQLGLTFDHFEEQEKPAQDDSSTESIVLARWYGESPADLRSGISFLSQLRQDVEANGWIHADDWKPQVVRMFGEEFFSLLSEWIPSNVDAVLIQQMVADHDRRYKVPLPAADTKGPRVVVDPNLSWQLGIKIIDLTRQHLESLARLRRSDERDASRQHRTSGLELATRYLTSATRELERAVAFYRYLKEQGM